MHLTRVGWGLLLALALPMVGCGDDTTADGTGATGTGGAGASGGGSSTGGTGTGGDATGGGSTGGMGTGGAATGGSGGAGDCNTLVNDGASVSDEMVSGPYPIMSGGMVPDGTYVLVKREDWDGTCNCVQKRKIEISGSGSVVNFVAQTDNDPEVRATGDVSFSTNQYTVTFTCGPAPFVGQSMTWEYTFTPGSPGVFETWDTSNGHHQLETYELQ